MMICKSDFEDLFPEIFQPDETCIARWEDDGGRTKRVPQVGPTSGSVQTSLGDSGHQPARAGEVFTTMPAAAAYGAAWVMLTTYDHLTRGHPVFAKNGRR